MDKVYFNNKKELEEKIRKIKEQGFNRLHVVSDFDRTLTKNFYQGKRIPSVVALIREGNYLSEDYPQKAFALFDKYHPIEKDETLDFEFRMHKMKEWWEKHEKLFIESKMNKKVINGIVNRYPRIFREGGNDFFRFLNIHKIPLLIFSSGIGNFIKEYLKKENLLTSNIHILSNIFKFNSQGHAIGYQGEIIHVLNKSETRIKDERYKQLITQRNNIILLGDSLADLGMVNDMEVNVIIKVAFLNENIEERLEEYRNKFDVVIVNDGSFDYINNLLQEIDN